MFGNEGHGHIPHTSTAAFFYPKPPAMNFSRLFGAVPVLTRGKSQNFHCLLFYLLIHIYIYTQKIPKLLPAGSGLVWRRRGPNWFGAHLVCSVVVALLSFFRLLFSFFLPFLFFF